jgi:bifunctional DNA-binding transcriptional regulator/antitoxin component of YhaV-PrlF toxin-antitoxin module
MEEPLKEERKKQILFQMVVRKENRSFKVYIPKESAAAIGIEEGDLVDVLMRKAKTYKNKKKV